MDRITEENCGTKISIASTIYGVKTEQRFFLIQTQEE
jgi:hypothetical protein